MRTLARAALLAVALLSAAGCKTDPYCLNCGSGAHDLAGGGGGGGAGGGGGGGGGGGQVDMTPDLTQLVSGCLPTNGGVEICDGIDNDCNGVVDDVKPDKVQSDPNNCGMCAHACDFTAIHQFGVCMAAVCKPAGCVPGYTDIDHNPANGCEYACTPTADPTEICDGKDNDCDGKIDEPFTNTWAADGTPRYDKLPSACGDCGNVCSLPGAVNACTLNAAGTKGTCVVSQCLNTPSVDTFRHNPSTGDINTTGCEYHCPFPSSTAGDCATAGTCTFPAEVCNGVDDNCNFLVDDSVTDPDVGTACGSACPGGTAAGCVGECKAGTKLCTGGVKVCSGSTGPTVETCNGKDDDCNGKIDDPFTTHYAASGAPLYDSDPTHCGSCSGTCGNLANATAGCQQAAPGAVGSCYVVSCDAGYAYVSHTDSNPAAPTCDVATAAPRDGTSGVGCFYKCKQSPSAPETCDGVDNDCDGCIDNGLTKPSNFCATKGVCAGRVIPILCKGASGWKCDYSGVPNVSLDGMGNLTVSEPLCDGLDNNCNDACDENFPDVAKGAGCGNPKAATSCAAGTGVCQRSGAYACTADKASESCQDGTGAPLTPDTSKATDEKCNGKDDDCNGLVDERTDYVVGGTTFKGWRDPVVPVVVGGATVYVYQYEATRPDATATSQGGVATRACSNAGVLPWANVTYSQAAAACAAIVNSAGAPMRLCSDSEWQTTCEGATPAGGPPYWSESASPASYTALACNDANKGLGTVLPTGTSSGGGESCYADWAGAGKAYDLSGNVIEWTSTAVVSSRSGVAGKINAGGGTAGQIHLTNISGFTQADVGGQVTLSGATAPNNGTFTIAQVNSATDIVLTAPSATAAADPLNPSIHWTYAVTYQQLRGGSYSSPPGGTSCEFSFDIAKPGYFAGNLGFRCCSDAAP